MAIPKHACLRPTSIALSSTAAAQTARGIANRRARHDFPKALAWKELAEHTAPEDKAVDGEVGADVLQSTIDTPAISSQLPELLRAERVAGQGSPLPIVWAATRRVQGCSYEG